MWKNVFIESCILSALIFGGFYFNASILKKEITVSQDNIQNESAAKNVWTHISGNAVADKNNKGKDKTAHLSGNLTEGIPVPPISGTRQPPLPSHPDN